MKLVTAISLLLFAIFTIDYSEAAIVPIDVGTNAVAENSGINDVTFNSSGNKGDYTLLLCGTTSDGSNTFNDLITNPPAGAIVTELDNNQCADGRCVMGVWGIFSTSADNDLTCNWTDTTTVFGGGFFRFSGVDFNNPVIDIQCDTGFSPTATAPSIITEDNSRVIRFFVVNIDLTNIDTLTEDSDTDTFTTGAISDTENLFTEGLSERFDIGGPTGTEEFSAQGVDSYWRACTIGLRMQGNDPIVRPIPTLSEWGLLAMAGVLGMVGFIAVRRRKLAA